jgi:hypothetical protein
MIGPRSFEDSYGVEDVHTNPTRNGAAIRHNLASLDFSIDPAM